MPSLAYLLLLILPFQSSGGDVVVKGRYSNYDYAYSVHIPKGLTGFRAAAPAPNHGFGITLSEQPKSSVWVDASYNAAFWKSFDDAIQAHMGYIKDRDVNAKLVRKWNTRIAGLAAQRFIIEYKAKDATHRLTRSVQRSARIVFAVIRVLRRARGRPSLADGGLV